jgi:hypothetical protein
MKMNINDDLSNFKNTKDINNKNINTLTNYFEIIEKRCEDTIEINKSKIANNEKMVADTISIPKYTEYLLIINQNYNVQQLKSFAKYYKLKLSGNKPQLITRLYVFLKLSSNIIKIQKIFRGKLQRTYNNCHGPAFINRALCTNATDFLTIEDMKVLPFSQFISYKDVDNFIYGFDIISLYNLILKSGINVKNPYNRNEIPKEVVNNIRNLYFY